MDPLSARMIVESEEASQCLVPDTRTSCLLIDDSQLKVSTRAYKTPSYIYKMPIRSLSYFLVDTSTILEHAIVFFAFEFTSSRRRTLTENIWTCRQTTHHTFLFEITKNMTEVHVVT